MKKLILPAFFMGAIAFGSTSCKKEYTCTCTILGVSETDKKTSTKKDAEAWCDAKNNADNGAKCELN